VRREAILWAALAFIALLASLTTFVIVRQGLDPVVVLALIVLALFCFGVVGALRHPPEE